MPNVVRWWSSSSDTDRLYLYTRWTFYSFLGALPFFALALVDGGAEPAPPHGVGLFMAACAATAAGSIVVARTGLAAHRRDEPLPVLPVVAAFAAAGVTAGVGVWALRGDGPTPVVFWAVALPLGTVLTACSTVWTTRRLCPPAIVIGVLSAFVAYLDGAGAPAAAVLAVVLSVTVLAVVTGFRFSVWVLDVVREMARSREVQLHLAVAEERLRFARDLHDVMGRDLSTIAVKSQLAAELVRRGHAGAADELADISRIAEGSLREVREVVRGYRSADLASELAGARSVLRAAGVACTVVGEGAGTGLPEQLHAALGWVVREAVTNVLRHSSAAACTITLTVTEREVRLTVVNDGAGDEGAGWGSGLTGLAERLAALDGRLRAESDAGTFTVDARLPAGAAA
ncbi:sensor histidine kinase [Blastococcus haudaquaticus]|uniref:sensor histidine kinase n=1 Tax=Blastococcus haudaquaticus TaxID=1938745 RepID=UPI00190EFE93|nr:sensor histidine kinase [Blastococcus haudaquaticus]